MKNKILKCAELDFILLKPYLKSIFFVLIMPLTFSIFTHSLTQGMLFSVSVLGMTCGYTFSISEKNNMEKFYGFLPVSKKDLVLGKYIFIMIFGILGLIVSLCTQLLTFHLLNEPQQVEVVVISTLASVFLYSIYVCFQIPGYYKFGSIKGRSIMFFPIVVFLVIYGIISPFQQTMETQIGLSSININLAFLYSTIIILFMFFISYTISINNISFDEK